MTPRLRRLFKYVGVGLLAAGIAGLPTVASAHGGDHGHYKHYDRGHGHYKHRKHHDVYRYYRAPRVERHYYYEPRYVYEPYYVVPRVYDYDYVPRRPYGNIGLTLDFPFYF
jgi:hypothetical protein